MPKAPLADCENCPLQDAHFVPPDGDVATAKYAYVGEAPGFEETQQDRGFVGQSGELLWRTAEQHDLHRGDGWTTNAVLCRPPNNDLKAVPKAVVACRPRLQAELEQLPEDATIVALGLTAVESITGKRGVSMGAARKSELVFGGRKVVGTWHPAYILRPPGVPSYLDLYGDLGRIKAGLINRRPEFRMARVSGDAETLRKILDTIGEGQPVAIDLETSGYDPREDEILCIAMAWKPDFALIIDWVGSDADVDVLQSFLAVKRPRQVYFNGKFDVQFLHAAGIALAAVYEDVMLQSYALDERGGADDAEERTRAGVHDLKTVAHDYLGYLDWEVDLKKYLPNKAASFALVPKAVLEPYAATDAFVTIELFDLLEQKVVADGIMPAYKLMMKVLPKLMRMEQRGISVDQEYVQKLADEKGKELSLILTKLQEVTGRQGFNPDSPKQVSEVLPMLPPRGDERKRAIRSLSTQKSVAGGVAKLVLMYRDLRTDRSTHILGLLDSLDRRGYAHPQYMQHGTQTGRPSGKRPNILNVPRTLPGELGLRGMYVAPESRSLVSADYNQHELRTAAFYSGDPVLTQVYVDDGDIHTEVSLTMFGENFTTEDRVVAKMFNFGVTYGMGPGSIVEKGYSREFAQQAYDSYWQRFAVLKKWLEEQEELALTQGWIQTIFGRKRRWPLIIDGMEKRIRNQADNAAIQGTAWDLTSLALVHADDAYLQPVITVYDSITVEVWDYEVDDAVATLRDIMLEVPKTYLDTDIPWKVDIKVGKRWS